MPPFDGGEESFMKKCIVILFNLILLIGFIACSDEPEKANNNSNTEKGEKSIENEFVTSAEKEDSSDLSSQKNVSSISPTVAVNNKEEGNNEETALELEPFIEKLSPRPFAVNFNQYGEMFIVCAPPSGNGILYQVSTLGELKEICEVKGTFMGPGMAFDQNNDIYIPTGTELKKYKVDGTYEVVASGFKNAWDVTVDIKNNIYISDEMQEAVYRITPSGDNEVIIEPDKKTGMRFLQGGIEYNPVDDCLYLVYNSSIYKYTLSSENIMQSQELIYQSSGIRFIAINEDGKLYVDQEDSVVVIEPDTKTAQIYKSNGNKNFVGLNFGIGEFNEKTLYIATANSICKYSSK